MKRITSACLLQTIRFNSIDGTDPKLELDAYLSKLDKKKSKYTVLESKNEENGSIVIKIKRQYLTYSTEGYLD